MSRGGDHAIQGRHPLQQFLRVRAEQGRPGGKRLGPEDRALVGGDRRRGRQAGYLCPRGFRQTLPTGRAHLSAALRGSLVDGDPLAGLSLADLLKRVEPNGQAKFVRFETLQRPEQMVGQRSGFSVIDWPYMEGLRMDEAMHPLAILAVGMYGRLLPNQNGAPLRLVVPWKYGFKSIKSIVRISLVREQPRPPGKALPPTSTGSMPTSIRRSTTRGGPRPRAAPAQWVVQSQCAGYADVQWLRGEVASLYSGMDLRKYY